MKITAYVPQPDAITCQSACVAKMMGLQKEDVQRVRRDLVRLGNPGDPYIMGSLLKGSVKEYKFDETSSITDMRRWLTEGYQLITHGWFTNPGHVICLVGTYDNGFIADDPWGEFDAPRWKYSDNWNGDDLKYSNRLIYASCVASYSCDQAATIYSSRVVNLKLANAWVHRIKN